MPQQFPPSRWEPLEVDRLDQLNSVPTVVVVGGVAQTPRVSSFMRLRNPRTAAENQEDPKSRPEGTKQLSSSPWWLAVL